jgi:Fe-S cluster assembly iron-binding protein IscA
MLALTPSATKAISGILTQHGLPDSAGLRIVQTETSLDGPEAARETGLQVLVVEGPAETDQVVDESGARVFVEEAVAPLLDDKLLDANIAEKGVSFSIVRQAA